MLVHVNLPVRQYERREKIEDQDPEDSFSNTVLSGGSMYHLTSTRADNDFRGRLDLMGYLVPLSHRGSDAGTSL